MGNLNICGETHIALEHILDNIDTLICVTDIKTHEILFINKAMEQAYNAPNAKGKICYKVLQTGFDSPCPFCPVGKLRTITSSPIIWESHDADTNRTYKNTSKLIEWAGGDAVHIRYSVDITEIKSAEMARKFFDTELENKVNERTEVFKLAAQQAEKARKSAEKSAKEKDMFLANASHEIRTPMNTIIGLSDIMLAKGDGYDIKKYIKDVKNASDDLLRIVNDILDMSKIEAGKLEIVPVNTNLLTLFEDLSSMFSFIATSKGLEFISDINLKGKEYVYLDEVRLKQVIANLLSNAVKFTMRGSITLMVKVISATIYIEVTDTGEGIKERDRKQIFYAFRQAELRKNRTIKGTGLGLAISKNLVDLMNGRIWVTSKYGAGSTFRVELPYVEGDPTAIELNSGSSIFSAPTAKVLVVDDLEANLAVATGLLRINQISPHTAMSGAEALTLLAKHDYDLIFMDDVMQHMDGVQTLHKIRELGGKCANVPIIALTANASPETRAYLMKEGMDDFLSKPVEFNKFCAVLKKWLPADVWANCLESELPNEFEPPMTNSPDKTKENTDFADTDLARLQKTGIIDVDSALKRLGAPIVLKETLKAIAKSLDSRVEKLTRSLEEGDLKTFSVLAHGLKGSFSNISAAELSNAAAMLETAAKEGDVQFVNNNTVAFAENCAHFGTLLKEIFSA